MVITSEGREILTYLPGTAGHPPLTAPVRSERALRSAGRGVRALHDATDGFVPPEPAGWAGHDLVAPVAIDCIGHGDLNPGNLLFDGDQVVGIIFPIKYVCSRFPGRPGAIGRDEGESR